MIEFGFSAFLRVLLLNAKPQTTALNYRLAPSQGGYDYHRSLRLRASRYLVAGEAFGSVMASCSEIRNNSERNSAEGALKKLKEWREANPGPIKVFGPKTYVSPGKLFKVRFQPDFGLNITGVDVAIHIWNTAKPTLVDRIAQAALSLFRDLYAEDQLGPGDLAVLSLQDGKLRRLSEGEGTAVIGSGLVKIVDGILQKIIDDKKGPSKGPPGPSKGPPAP